MIRGGSVCVEMIFRDLPFLDRDALQDGPARGAVVRVTRQEDEPGPVVTGGGKGDAEPRALTREEGVRHLDENARAVAGVHLAAAGPAVQEVLQDREGLADDRVGLAALDVHHEADPAGVVLVGRVVQALRRGEPRARHRRHAMIVRHGLLSPPHVVVGVPSGETAPQVVP